MWTSRAEFSCSGGGSSFTGEEASSGAGEYGVAGTRNVGACRRCWFVYVWAGTGTRGMFRHKRSPEEEKNKLVKQKKSLGSIVKGKKVTPRQ
jgi:hypothetical protein